MFTRTCDLDGCHVEFQTDNPRKTHCTRQHSTLHRMRRLRAKRRKGGPGGGNGGGGGPTLFDELVTVDPQAIVVLDTCYRTPTVSPVPEKHPPARVRQTGLGRVA